MVVSCILYRCCSQIDVPSTVVPWWTIPLTGAFLFPLGEFSSSHDLTFLMAVCFLGEASESAQTIEVIGCIVISWNERNCGIHSFESDSLTNFYIFGCKENPSNLPTGECLECLGRGGNISPKDDVDGIFARKIEVWPNFLKPGLYLE